MRSTRREFLHWSAAAGAGWLLSGCAASDERALPAAAEIESPAPPLPVLVSAGDPQYDRLRRGYNLRIDAHPRAIALCSSTDDVVAAVRHARDNGLAVAVRSGGHSMEGWSSNDGGLVVDLSRLDGVAVQADGSAHVGPGVILSKLYDALLPRGVLIPAGSCGTVGIGGLTLGGGYGFFSRRHGLTCDHLRAATLVDGRGRVHSTRDDPELLWALRGGGAGNFGIVTAMEFDTRPAPAVFHSHRVRARGLTAAAAARWFERWFAFAAALPDTAFSACVLNRSTLYVLVTDFTVSDATVKAAVTAFAAGAAVSSDSRPIGQALQRYYGSLAPLAFKNASAGFYASFADIEAVIEPVLQRVIDNPGMIYQINTVGGRIGDPALQSASCYPHRRFGFISELQAYWQKPEQQPRLLAVTAEIQALIRAHGITAQYVNYCSTDFPEWWRSYYADSYPRLQAIKRRYDPDDRIRHPQSVRT